MLQALRTSVFGSGCDFLSDVSAYFQTGGAQLNVNTLTGASWYVLNTAANALPTGGRWLVAQITTTGAISGTLNYQVFPLGDGANKPDSTLTSMLIRWRWRIPRLCDTVCGCMDDSACNFNADANNEDGSCEYAADNYDCEGNCIAVRRLRLRRQRARRLRSVWR